MVDVVVNQRASHAKKPPRLLSTACLSGGMVVAIAFQYVAFHRYQHEVGHYRNEATPHAMVRDKARVKRPKKEFMWSKEAAYTRHCELHYKHNATWGKAHAPYVDKIEAKNVVKRMQIPEFKVIPTLAVFDEQNITAEYTLEALKRVKQPFIIKSTHVSGGVARVFNDTYHCFKYCFDENVLPLGPEALNSSQHQLRADLSLDYSLLGAELQYRYIAPRIILEEDVLSGSTDTDVTHWWLSNGHPVFANQQCETPRGIAQGFRVKRTFVGTDYRRLPIQFNADVCKDTLAKPENWDAQLQIMKEVGTHFPGEVVRVDIYAGGDQIWFSEFTFTSAGCWKRFTPALTDGVLYALMRGELSPHEATPRHIEEMLTDESWVLISLDAKRRPMPKSHAAYPSPVDLCLSYEALGETLSDGVAPAQLRKERNERRFRSCIRAAKEVRTSSLRCIASIDNGTQIRSFGVDDFADTGSSTSNIDICADKAFMNVNI